MASFYQFHAKLLNANFLACRALKHYAVSNYNQATTSVVQPGDYVVVDHHYSMMIFSRQQFKKAFGHEILQQLDDDI